MCHDIRYLYGNIRTSLTACGTHDYVTLIFKLSSAEISYTLSIQALNMLNTDDAYRGSC